MRLAPFEEDRNTAYQRAAVPLRVLSYELRECNRLTHHEKQELQNEVAESMEELIAWGAAENDQMKRWAEFAYQQDEWRLEF